MITAEEAEAELSMKTQEGADRVAQRRAEEEAAVAPVAAAMQVDTQNCTESNYTLLVAAPVASASVFLLLLLLLYLLIPPPSLSPFLIPPSPLTSASSPSKKCNLYFLGCICSVFCWCCACLSHSDTRPPVPVLVPVIVLYLISVVCTSRATLLRRGLSAAGRLAYASAAARCSGSAGSSAEPGAGRDDYNL